MNPINPLQINGNIKNTPLLTVEELVKQAIDNEKINKEHAHPIVTNLMGAFEAFQAGAEQAIAAFLKLGNEGHITQKLVFGPQNKSNATIELEQVVKALLHTPNKVKFVKKDDKYLVFVKGHKIDFTKAMKQGNFNHIQLTQADRVAYHKLILAKSFVNQPYLPQNIDSSYDVLSMGEKEAINVYTGSAYEGINKLLRGDLKAAVGYLGEGNQQKKAQVMNTKFKELLLHAAMAISGLKKLPDFASEGNMNYLYRLESNLSPETIQKRKDAISQGGLVTREMGFMSTSYERPVWHGDVGLLIENVKGKDVSGLSMFPGEREVLLPPTQVQWLEHKTVNTYYNGSVQLFMAKPVTVPHEKPTIENQDAHDAWVAIQKLHDQNVLA